MLKGRPCRSWQELVKVIVCTLATFSMLSIISTTLLYWLIASVILSIYASYGPRGSASAHAGIVFTLPRLITDCQHKLLVSPPLPEHVDELSCLVRIKLHKLSLNSSVYFPVYVCKADTYIYICINLPPNTGVQGNTKFYVNSLVRLRLPIIE